MDKKKININDLKYVFFDMDGTLFNSNKEILPSSLKIIEKIKNMGIQVSICTGRPYFFTLKEIEKLNISIPIISCNGALIFDPTNQKVIAFNQIKTEIAQKIFNFLLKYQATFLIYSQTTMYRYKPSTNKSSVWFSWINKTNENFEQKHKLNVVDIDKNFDISKINVIKFLVIDSEIKVKNVELIKNELEKIDSVYAIKSQFDVFDIMPKGFDKGQGLKILENKKYIDLNQTIVFGDAENDLPMFEVARFSVAMNNAIDDVKVKASFITDDNNNDGIANFFVKIINNEN